MGLQSPISYTVSDVTIYNGKRLLSISSDPNLIFRYTVDMMNTSSLTHLVLKEMQIDSKQGQNTAAILNKCFNVSKHRPAPLMSIIYSI